MISPRPDLLALDESHFHEVCKAVNNKDNTDPRKNLFKQDLLNLSECLLAEDIYSMPEPKIKDRLSVLGLFLNWALALDSRNGYTLSKPMRLLLDNLCEKWIPEHDKYVFAVTDGDYSVQRYVSGVELTPENVKNLFGVEFSHQLVIFRVPKHLAGDFLYSCVLYHEMGHFVDSYHNISCQIFNDITTGLGNGSLTNIFLNEFFPYSLRFVGVDWKLFNACLLKHTGEYVADLFGAQYVGKNICNLMESLCHVNYGLDDIEHPSPNLREKMVSDFVNGVTTNRLLNMIVAEFSSKTLVLKPRFKVLSDEAKLKTGEPLSIGDDDELHSIINLGWEVYFSKASTMESLMGLPSNSIDNYSFYNKINEGIRVSIENYFPH